MQKFLQLVFNGRKRELCSSSISEAPSLFGACFLNLGTKLVAPSFEKIHVPLIIHIRRQNHSISIHVFQQEICQLHVKAKVHAEVFQSIVSKNVANLVSKGSLPQEVLILGKSCVF